MRRHDFMAGGFDREARTAGLTTKEDDMEAIISNLVSRFEKGSLSRRELVRGLAMAAAGGTAASAQEGLNFGAATIDHVSIQVADLKRSSEFYQKMFGFKEVSGEPARNILRLGNTRTLVSLNLEKPIATVDHFAIGIPRYNKEAAVRYFTERGVKPLEGNFAGFHVLDPDGIRVQIGAQS
jgi:catechol 2,3-dioxygenase-like lactoylglutathione lyase family enzyme